MSGLNIACGTVLFRKYPLEKALETIRSIGFEWVETQAVGPWCPHVTINETDPIKYADLVKKIGFKGTTAIWMPNGTIISNEKSVESAKLTLEWAHAAGIPVVNTGDGYKSKEMSDEEAFKNYEDRMLRILETCEKTLTYIALEPHGTFSLTCAGLERLVSFTESPWLGINYDACNIRRAYYIENGAEGSKLVQASMMENECDVLKRVVKKVVHTHAKDMKDGKCVALTEGIVDTKGWLAILKQAGYNGAISLETEGEEDFDTTVSIAKKGLSFLHSISW